MSEKKLIDALYEKNVIKKDGSTNSNINRILEFNPSLKRKVLDSTSFLDSTYPNIKLSMRIYFIKNSIKQVPICEHPECNNHVIINNRRVSRHCSAKCSRTNPKVMKKYDDTCLKLYGNIIPSKTEKIKQKTKDVCQKRYNADSPLESEEIRKKIDKTNLKKYGKINVFSVDYIREKIEKTNLKKYNHKAALGNKEIYKKTQDTLMDNYGVKVPLKSKDIRKKLKNTWKEKHNVEHISQRHIPPNVLKVLNDKDWLYKQHVTLNKPFTIIGKELGVDYGTVAKHTHKFGIYTNHLTNVSYSEREISNFLENLNVKFVSNTRSIISPYEIDFYIQEHNLAIEFDGIYWHSELSNTEKDYHLNKTILCGEKNIRLIHIFENEWLFKQEIVKSRISSLLNKNERIFARKCHIENIASKEARSFVNNTHIQGNRSAPIKLGLIYNNELVALMTFGKSRYNKKYEWEMIRYSTKLNTNVIGGASKLLTHFKKVYSPKSIISYADRRWSNGSMYEKLGFTFNHNSDPNYYYFKNNDTKQLFSRIQFQKHKLPNKLAMYDPNMSEWENMVNNCYNRIWDCGNAVYVWNN